MKKLLLCFIFSVIFVSIATADPIIIMWMGDSYIVGNWGDGGDRSCLDSILVANGCVVQWAGRYNTCNGTPYFSDPPGEDHSADFLNFDWAPDRRWHEGVTGKAAFQWATPGPGDVTTAMTINIPDVLRIYIGLNDVANRTRTSIMMRNDVDTMLCMAWRKNAKMRINCE